MTGNRFETGDEVDVAQDGLNRPPRFEHGRGEVVDSDIDVDAGLHQQTRLQKARSISPIEALTRGVRPGFRQGPVVEVCSHENESLHDDATYHIVEFDGGNLGCYPESALVPTPETLVEMTSRSDESSDGEDDDVTHIPIEEPEEDENE